MRMMTRTPPALLGLLAIVAATSATSRSGVSAQETRSLILNAGAAAIQSAAHPAERDVVRSRTALLDPGALQTSAGALVSLALFPDVTLTAAFDRVEVPGQGRFTWVGRVLGMEDGIVTVAVANGVAAGDISTPDGHYRIHVAGDSYAIEQINTSALPPELPPIRVDAAAAAPAADPSVAADDGSQIDVMVVYTPSARVGAGGTAAMIALIDLAVSNSNTSYANSGVTQRLRLVHSEEVNYAETVGDMSVDLVRLRSTTDGVMDGVHVLRNTFRADFVTLLTAGTDACGIGYLMAVVSPTFQTSAFNVTAYNCAAGNLSMAHELGHNMGLAHDAANASGSASFPYAFGYRDPGFFRTVMSYQCELQGLPRCDRVMHFSTPTRTYNGRVTGVAGATEAARALNNTAPTTANFRTAVTTPSCTYAINPPSVSIGSARASGTINVTATSGCTWTAITNNASVILIDSGSSGNGSGPVGFTVTANTTATTRTATATIAGVTFTVTQAAAVPCTYTINPESVSIGPALASGSINVTTTSGCTWTAVSTSPSVVRIDSGSSGSGSGKVGFTVAANTVTSSRTGTATIAGRIFTVLQGPLVPCTYTVNPPSVSLGNIGASGTILVTTAANCPWSALSSSSFIMFSDGAGRIGSGRLPFTVATNPGMSMREGAATIAGQAFTVSQQPAPRLRLAPDLNNDGHVDLIWQNRTQGFIEAWTMNNRSAASTDLFSPSHVSDPNWRIAATADMDGDGKLDLIWQEDTQGWIGIWKMNGLSLVSSLALSIERIPDTNWKIVAAQDFNGDGKADLVWQHQTEGYVALWYMNGATVMDSVLFSPGRVSDTNWKIEGAADFNSDGQTDLLWRHQTQGWLTVWLLNGTTLMRGEDLSPQRVADTNWHVAAIGDVNRDNMPDLIWHDVVNGWIGVWLMNGSTLTSSLSLTPERMADVNWKLVGPK